MSILNVDKIQPIGGGSTITVDATDIQASTGTITANSYTGVDNTLKVSIGGTEYVRTHSTGQVSIGSTFMWRTDTVAQVYGKSPDLSLSRFNDQFMISGNETSGAINTGAGIQFFGHDGVSERGMAYIRGLKENGTSGDRASYLAFATRINGGTLEERLRITSGGSIGIKNTSPNSQYFNNLVIGDNNAGDWGITIRTSSSNKGVLAFSDSDAADANRYDGYIAYHHNDQSMRVHTGGANQRLRIDSVGRIGIGTDTLDSSADVSITNASSSARIYMKSADNADCSIYFGSMNDAATGAIRYDHSDDSLRFYGYNNGEYARILGGALLVNRTAKYASSGEKLSVNGMTSIQYASTSAAPLYIFNTDTTGSGTVQPFIFLHDGNGIRGGLGLQYSTSNFIINANNVIQFRTGASGIGGTERVRIDGSGRLLIGATSSRTIANHAARIQLQGTDYQTSTLSITNNANTGNGAFIFLASQRSGSVGGSTVLQNNDNIGTLRFFAGDGTDINSYAAEIQVQIDGTPGSNDTPGRLVFRTTADGAASPTERLRIDSSGNVTKPTNFHILVDRNGNQTGYSATFPGDVIAWNRVRTSESSPNASNHFNTSTGIFTAPVTGLYHFHASVNCSFNCEGGWIVVNGSRPNFSTFYPNYAQSADGHLTYHLTAGDELGLKWYQNGGTNTTINSNSLHTWWRIVLLG